VSEIAGELARVKGAFAQPTLTLLHQRQAPVVENPHAIVGSRSA